MLFVFVFFLLFQLELCLWWISGHHLLSALAAYLAPLLLADALFPRRALPLAAPTVWRLAGEVLLALLAYDLLFFACHAALHHVRALRPLHARHHAQPLRTMRAAETLRLSLVDGALQVACSVAALNLTQAHPLSRAVFDVAITYWLSEIHSGYDFPWMAHNVVPGGLIGGSVAHERHHLENRYSFLFTCCHKMLF